MSELTAIQKDNFTDPAPDEPKSHPAFSASAGSVRQAIDLFEDAIEQHKSPDSPWYNDCEKSEDRCQWCVEAQAWIDAQNDQADTSK